MEKRRHLFDSHELSSDLSEILSHYKWNKREKLPSVYTPQKVSQIESSIKRGDATGKRNYAMMLLATRLGLRASEPPGCNASEKREKPAIGFVYQIKKFIFGFITVPVKCKKQGRGMTIRVFSQKPYEALLI